MNPADNIAIQYALYRGLRSSSLFTGLNVVLGREYIASKVEQDAVWQSPSPGGQAGIGEREARGGSQKGSTVDTHSASII